MAAAMQRMTTMKWALCLEMEIIKKQRGSLWSRMLGTKSVINQRMLNGWNE